MVKKVELYEAMDGTRFESKAEAENHEFAERAIPEINKFLDEYIAQREYTPKTRNILFEALLAHYRWLAEQEVKALQDQEFALPELATALVNVRAGRANRQEVVVKRDLDDGFTGSETV